MSINKKNSDGSHSQVAGMPYVTKDNLGIEKVENKSSEDIRGEITSKNVTDALGYTPVSEEELDLVKDVINGTAEGQFIYDTEAKMTKVVPDGVNKGIVAMIGGKTVKYNQLSYNNAKSSEQPTYNIYWYNLGNGLFQAKGTPTTNVVFPLNSGDVVNTTFKANHKYYLMGTKDGSEESYHICIWESSIGYLAYDYGNGAIFNPNKDYDAQFRLRVVSGYDLGTTGVTFKPRLIDLTVMFGSGNEPTTVDDERIIALRAYAEDNPEQTDGELWNVPVTEVTSVGRNLFNTEGWISRISTTVLPHTEGEYVSMSKFDPGTTEYIVKSFYIAESGDYGLKCDARSDTGILSSVGYTITDSPLTTYTNNPTPFSMSGNTSNAVTVEAGKYLNIVFTLISNRTGTLKYKNMRLQKEEFFALPYTPYNKTILLLDKIVDKLPDYGCSARDVYNYVDFEEMVYHHSVKTINMGDLPWTVVSAGKYKTTGIAYDMSYVDKSAVPDILLSDNTITSSFDKATGIANSGELYASSDNNNVVWCKSNTTTDASEFKKAVDGIYMIYAIKEELIPLTDLLLPFKCEPGGTITFENEHNLDVPNVIIYEKEMK